MDELEWRLFAAGIIATDEQLAKLRDMAWVGSYVQVDPIGNLMTLLSGGFDDSRDDTDDS